MVIGFGGCQIALLDSCSLLNLYATRRLAEILRALGVRFAVAAAVASEAVYVLGGGEGDETAERETLDLEPLIASGLLEVWSPKSEAEYVSFVNFAAELDDGEAMTCALALHRRGVVVTDDRKTLKVLPSLAPQVRALTTSQVLRQWSDLSRVDPPILRATLLGVQARGRFTPGKHDPLVAWWESAVGSQ